MAAFLKVFRAIIVIEDNRIFGAPAYQYRSCTVLSGIARAKIGSFHGSPSFVGGQIRMSQMPMRNLVLVVDDDPSMQKCVQRLLRHQAYEPILFSSAQAFRSHTDFDRAVCIILDVNLPDGSGIELRHRLKADGVFVPVIFMTGNDDPVVRGAALASGCIAFLTKPFSAQALLEPLKEATAARS
jgi:CheY-like chemotaxis protein